MNANFDEKQAFENLHDILNHIYNFANYYYDEMKKTQELCKEKDVAIKGLKNQLADERYQSEMRLKETIQNKNREIAALKEELSKQWEVFNTELKKSRNDFNEKLEKSREPNEKLTTLLNNVYYDLQTKKESLKSLEKALNNREKQLQMDSDTLVAETAKFEEELSNFYAIKEMQDKAPSNAERIKNFEEELRNLTLQKKYLDQQLDATKQKLKEVQAENEKLQEIAKQADRELQRIKSGNQKNAEIKPADDLDDDLNVSPMQDMKFSDVPADNADKNLNATPAEKSDTVNYSEEQKKLDDRKKLEWWK